MSASPFGSLPRQAPPPVLLAKPGLQAGPGTGLQTPAVPMSSYTHGSTSNPNHSASPRPMRHQDREREWGSVRRGSFVERCQELAKGSEAACGPGFSVPAGLEGGRRSLAVCSELESRFGLRAPTTFSVSPGARHSPGTPSSLSSPSSSSSHRRATPTSPTNPAPAAVSPSRCQTPVSPRHSNAASPASPGDVPASPESPASPPTAPPTSPKPHMNETSF